MTVRRTGWRGLLIAAAMGWAAPASAATPRIVVGEPAPEAEMTLLDGSKVALSSLRGQVVVLNFWATWCAPCRVELPLLDGYYRRVERHGLRVFAVTTEDSVPLHRLKPVFATLALTPVKRVKGVYSGIKAVPTNYVIDRAASKGRNPSTGAEVDIPARKVARFTPGKGLKDAVNA